VNALMTATYWEIGRRIVQSEQAGEKRAEYGKLLIKRLAKPNGLIWERLWTTQSRPDVELYLSWPQGEILRTPSAKSPAPILVNDISGNFSTIPSLANQFPLPWSAYVRLLSVKSQKARTFYETETLRRAGPSGNWTVRSAVNFINASRSQRTKPPCWR
jgi:hypothetical protein